MINPDPEYVGVVRLNGFGFNRAYYETFPELLEAGLVQRITHSYYYVELDNLSVIQIPREYCDFDPNYIDVQFLVAIRRHNPGLHIAGNLFGLFD